MLLQRFAPSDVFSSLREMQRLQSQLEGMLSSNTNAESREFPPINVWTSDAGAVIRAEVPGIDPDDIEISLVNDTLTIRGSRQEEPDNAEISWHKQERGCGQFTRSIKLPFAVDSDKIEARTFDGILQIKVPRQEADKPRKITVVTE